MGVDVSTIRDPRRSEVDEEAETTEGRLACLDRCLQELQADQRELVIEYDRDTERETIDAAGAGQAPRHHDERARRFAPSRTRATLEACVTACTETEEATDGGVG